MRPGQSFVSVLPGDVSPLHLCGTTVVTSVMSGRMLATSAGTPFAGQARTVVAEDGLSFCLSTHSASGVLVLRHSLYTVDVRPVATNPAMNPLPIPVSWVLCALKDPGVPLEPTEKLSVIGG